MNAKFAATFCAATLLLAGCVSAQGPGGNIPPQGLGTRGGITKDDLIYVTNGDTEVTVYDLATQALVGVLTNFTKPMGECADSDANVYITDASAGKILEFAHGGSKAIKTFDDSPDSPYTCAVDPTTGNLAVANNDGPSEEGNIAIWPKGSGQPTRYTNSTLYTFVACAYDANGNLLTSDGYRYKYGTSFAWLPRGGSTLVTVSIPPPPKTKWGEVAGIQWDGRFFVIDAGEYVYRVSVLHGLGYYIGETQLGNGGGGPYWIYTPSEKSQSQQIVGSGSYDDRSDVESFDYPSGSGPLFNITHGVDDAFGVVVSPK